MKTLVLYDSVYGNTEEIGKAICEGLTGEINILRIDEVKHSDLKSLDLLIVGSPVHGGRPTLDLEEFLKTIPPGSLKNVRVAAFDTRFAAEDHGIGIRILISVIRYAAERIAKTLKQKGGKLVVKPEGFIVKNKEGPLKEGELERARAWAEKILSVR